MSPPPPAAARRLAWDACYNARDVGGYRLAGGGQTRRGRFVRSDNLLRMSAAGRAALLASGVRTVLDLRSPFELGIDPYPLPPAGAAGAAPETPAYRNLPVLDPADAAEAAAIAGAATVAAMYAAILAHGRARRGTILRAVATAPAGGVLVSCHAGKDRTGLVTALVLAAAGAAAPDIADYAVSDGYLQPWYEVQLRHAPDAPARRRLARSLRSARNAARPETMLATLAHLDRHHGGAEAYCTAAGLGDAELGALRARLVTGSWATRRPPPYSSSPARPSAPQRQPSPRVRPTRTGGSRCAPWAATPVVRTRRRATPGAERTPHQ